MEERLDRLSRLDHTGGLEKAQADPMLHYRKIAARDQAVEEVIAEIKAIHSDISLEAKVDIALAMERVVRADAMATEARRELEVKRTKWEAKESLVQRVIDLLNNGPFPRRATEMDQVPSGGRQ